MERLRASSKTISLRNWRRPSAAATAAATSSIAGQSLPPENATNPRPKTSRYRSDGTLSFNHLVVDDVAAHTEARPSMPEGSCIVLKYLVDFLVKNKLHKNDLFLLDAKPSETTRLLRSVQDGDLPDRLRQYSSRSVSCVVLHSIAHTYAPLLPRDLLRELVPHADHQCGSIDPRVAVVAQAVQWQLSAERRAFFESLLLLLFRLSLKQTASMNAASLGELVASKLVMQDVAGTEEDLTVLRSVGQFLVANAREIVHTRQALSRSQSATLADVHSIQNSPYQQPRHSTAAALTSAAKIISRGSDAGHSLNSDASLPIQSASKRPLDEDSARRVSLVLTAMLESSQPKHGLFTARSQRSRDSTSMLYLRGAARSVDFDMASFHIHELASSVGGFLEDDAVPLFADFDARDLNPLEPFSAPLDTDKENTIVTKLQAFILGELPLFVQDVVVLLLATVRLVLDAGTDFDLLVAALTPWIFMKRHGDDDATSLCRILFVRMQDVLQPLMATRARNARIRQMGVVFRVAVWIAKCRQRAMQSRRCRANPSRHAWSPSMASSLCGIVETLLEQTRAYPSQLRRLYLDGGDAMEISILIEKLCDDSAGITAENFSPHSAALAVRRVLTTVLTPLGAQTQESPAQTRLKQLLLTHLDLLLRHETFASVRCDLEDAFDEMILDKVPIHAPEENAKIPRCTTEPRAEVDDEDAPEIRDEDCRISKMEASHNDNIRVAGTLSQWLASINDDGDSYRTSVKQAPRFLPPLGLTSDALHLQQDRLTDIRFVMAHCTVGSSAETDCKTRLFTLLKSLAIPPILVPRQRAAKTLDRIQNVNYDNKVTSTARLRDLEIVETLVLETMTTLGHPSLAPLYPSRTDQLGVLLDIWGLADRSVVLTLADVPPADC